MKVLLKIGDIVTHQALGQGTVVAADDEFCTIRFADDEMMFRLPDAFEKGFLTSGDAIITRDEYNENEDDEEEEEEEIEDDGDDGPEGEEPRLGFFDRLKLGILGAAAIDAARRHNEERQQESDRSWNDTIYWQDAARRDDPLDGDGDLDDW